jgi:GNAT superfamily N-acetyltransferase
VNGGVLTYDKVRADEFEELAGLRIEAMRESLEQVGRFDADRSRERLRQSFHPEHTRWIVIDGARVGFYAVRPVEGALQLDHLYLRPSCQSRGIGSRVMERMKSLADEQGLAIHLTALRESAANAFYQQHGFVKSGEEEWDIHYVWHPLLSSRPA